VRTMASSETGRQEIRRMAKDLHIAVDFNDDLSQAHRFFEKPHFDSLLDYCRELGVSRIEWIVDTIWSHYDVYPGDIDVLRYVTEGAHERGMELYAVIKPFEGCLNSALPHKMPSVAGASISDIRGILFQVRPFVAEHPDMRLKRMPGDWNPAGPIKAINLVKEGDAATRVQPEHLELLTSDTTCGFKRYEGPIEYSQSVQWRDTFPRYKQCRIITLGGLEIPEDQKYILIRCSPADREGDFTNELAKMVELIGEDGNEIPSTVSNGPAHPKHNPLWSLTDPFNAQRTRYGRSPEVREALKDTARIEEMCSDLHGFESTLMVPIEVKPHTLDGAGYVAVARGKAEYLAGGLHPAYPEVRKHWLELTQYCIDRGVDGVDYRCAHHTISSEPWAYGFNEPVMDNNAEGDVDFDAVARRTGEAYTQFLREARDLLHANGRKIAVHLHESLIARNERGVTPRVPINCDWQWETWVREIADSVVYRGVFHVRPWTNRRIVDRLSAVAAEAGKPFVYQCMRIQLTYDGPYPCLEREMEYVQRHPRVDAYQLYETANITHMDDGGRLHGSPHVAKLMRDNWR